MSPSEPEVSIILVSWNRCEDLRIALESLRAQRDVALEIIVVDNGSRDGTLEMLASQFPETLVIENNSNRGACVGKNQGILKARAEHIAFMDSDACLLEPLTVRHFLDRLKSDPLLGGISGPIYIDREQQIPWVFGIHLTGNLYIDWVKTRSGHGEADALSTCFVMLPRKAVLETGGFDPVYFYQHEDLDFFIRMRRLGYRLETVDRYPIWHRISQTGRNMDRWFWMHFREEWRHQYLVIKNLGWIAAVRCFMGVLLDSSEMRAYYVRPIRKRKFVALFVCLPLIMLLLSPWILWQNRKRPLDEMMKHESPQAS